MKTIDLNVTFNDISQMKNNTFKKTVETKVKKSALQYLQSKIKSKGKEIPYQNNLLPNNILSLQEQRAILSFLTRMNPLKYNYSSNNTLEHCKCGREMTNIHLYECKMLDKSERTVDYSKIFNGRLCEMKYLINILLRNQNQHDQFTQAQDHKPSSH